LNIDNDTAFSLDKKNIDTHISRLDEVLSGKKALGKLELSDTQRKELADAVEKKE
jgi:hypothetical protein